MIAPSGRTASTCGCGRSHPGPRVARGLASSLDVTGLDMDSAELAVQNRLAQVRASLPSAVVARASRMTFSTFPIAGISMTSSSGRSLADMTVVAEDLDGALRQAKLTFVARDVPAMGYGVYEVRNSPRDTKTTSGLRGSV